MNTRFHKTILALTLAVLLAPGAAIAAPGERGDGPGRFGKDMSFSGDPVQQVEQLQHAWRLADDVGVRLNPFYSLQHLVGCVDDKPEVLTFVIIEFFLCRLA